jgi:Domain of unknown function (DUF4440)
MSLRRTIGFSALGLATVVASGCTHTQRATDATFGSLIAARHAAMARGDTATVHRQLADDMNWVIGASGGTLSAAQFLAAVSHVQTPPPRYEIDSLHARALGTVATVAYRRVDRRTAGTYEATNLTRCLDVFVRRGSQWLLVEHSQTWIVQSPPPVRLDAAALGAFIGHYEIAPGFVDDVHWEGKELVATVTGQMQGGRLVPVSTSAFSPDGVAPLIVFERDATGRVVGYVQGSPDGGVRRARRIE